MVFCGEKGLGGDDDVELLSEPWGKGLWERFEGLVLLGLGPRAILSVVVAVLQQAWSDKEGGQGCEGDGCVESAGSADTNAQDYD